MHMYIVVLWYYFYGCEVSLVFLQHCWSICGASKHVFMYSNRSIDILSLYRNPINASSPMHCDCSGIPLIKSSSPLDWF